MHGQHMVRVKPALAICLARAELLFSPTVVVAVAHRVFGKPWETASLSLPSSFLLSLPLCSLASVSAWLKVEMTAPC